MDVALREELKAKFVESGPTDVDIFVKRPIMLMVCRYEHDGKVYSEIGWSKVSRPDEWSESYGIEMAIRKSAASLAKRLAAGADDEIPDQWIEISLDHEELERLLAETKAAEIEYERARQEDLAKEKAERAAKHEALQAELKAKKAAK